MSLAYSFTGKRILTVTSPGFLWNQILYNTIGDFLDQQGFNQWNKQETQGQLTAAPTGQALLVLTSNPRGTGCVDLHARFGTLGSERETDSLWFFSGNTSDQFYETSGGSSHSRFVRAVNVGSEGGAIGSEGGAQPGGLQVGWSLSAGGSVKGVLGRGPGELGH